MAAVSICDDVLDIGLGDTQESKLHISSDAVGYLVPVEGEVLTEADKQVAADMDKAEKDKDSPLRPGDDYLTDLLHKRCQHLPRYPVNLKVLYEDSTTIRSKMENLYDFQRKQYEGITDEKRGLYLTTYEFASVCLVRPVEAPGQDARTLFPKRNSRIETRNNMGPDGKPIRGPPILSIDFNQKFNDAARIFNEMLVPLCKDLGITKYGFRIRLDPPYADTDEADIKEGPDGKKPDRDFITSADAKRIREHKGYQQLREAYEDFISTATKPIPNPFQSSPIKVEAFYFKPSDEDFKFLSEYYMHHAGKKPREVNYLGYRNAKGEKDESGDPGVSLVPSSADQAQYFEDPFDYKLIDDYVNAGLAKRSAEEMAYAEYKKDADTTKMSDIEKNIHETFRGYNMLYRLCECENLIMLAEEWLGCVSLTHKVYIYVALLMHHTLLEETTDITGIDFFKNEQDIAISDWTLGHIPKIAGILQAIWKETTDKRDEAFLELKKVERGLAAIQVAEAKAVSLMREDLRAARCPPIGAKMTEDYNAHITQIREEKKLGRHIFEMSGDELKALAEKSKKEAEQRRAEEEKKNGAAAGDNDDDEEPEDGDGDDNDNDEEPDGDDNDEDADEAVGDAPDDADANVEDADEAVDDA